MVGQIPHFHSMKYPEEVIVQISRMMPWKQVCSFLNYSQNIRIKIIFTRVLDSLKGGLKLKGFLESDCTIELKKEVLEKLSPKMMSNHTFIWATQNNCDEIIKKLLDYDHIDPSAPEIFIHRRLRRCQNTHRSVRCPPTCHGSRGIEKKRSESPIFQSVLHREKATLR